MEYSNRHRAERTTPNTLPATLPSETASLRPKPQLTRRYETQYLKPNGDIGRMTRVAPALPVFESTCAAIARGTLIETEYGPIAIEDLAPGMGIKTATGGLQTLSWRGQTLLIRGIPNQSPEMGTTIRVSSDRFGFDRPSRPLMLGPKARVMMPTSDQDYGFRAISELIDDDTVTSVAPMSPVEVYHLAFENQQVISASGVQIESYHPGRKLEKMIPRDALSMLMSLFPHITSIADFGTQAFPRLDRRGMMNAI